MRRITFSWLCLMLTLWGEAGLPAAGQSAPSGGSRHFPSSVLDFSHRLEAPAGERGFLFAGSDGHFYFPEGARARFWGINVAKDSVFQPHETIDEVLDLFAHAGINLVRLHHLDDVGGLLPLERAGLAERICPQARDQLDYWIAGCKARGIYVYLDLLSYRTFTEAEGVQNAAQLGRAAKPAAFYNERLIRLQMDFAQDLLARHVNPYTGLRYVDDPAISMVEICDEHGLLLTRGRWGEIPSPYREELLRRWNYWLRDVYGTTEALRQAWAVRMTPRPPPPATPPPGAPTPPVGPLAEYEQLEKGTIALPGVSPEVLNPEAREADLRRFGASVEREYLAQMATFLREIGVRVPITAVTDYSCPASLQAAADTLDFLAGNYYYAHPVQRADLPEGVRFFFEGSNAVASSGSDTAVRRLCGAKVGGKPLAIREWNVCWPNPYRAAGVLEAAALGAQQDVDALILFAYYTQPTARGLGPFDVSNDPSMWGLMALAGEVFRDEPLQAVGPRVAILWDSRSAYEQADKSVVSGIYDLGRWAVVENWFPGHRGKPADVYALVSRRAERLLPLGTSADQVVYSESVAALTARTMERLRQFVTRPGPLRYNSGQGVLSVTGAPVRFIAGRVEHEQKTPDGQIWWTSSTPRAALVWLALDEWPPLDSQQWLAKMVTGAWNTREETRHHWSGAGQNFFALLDPGSPPVTTGGKDTASPSVLTVGERQVLRMWMRGGVWELHQTPTERRLHCDTAGVEFEFPDLAGAVPQAMTTTGLAPLDGPPWVFPEGAEYVTVPLGGPQEAEHEH